MYKSLFLYTLLLFILPYCGKPGKVESDDDQHMLAKVEVREKIYDFGSIHQGDSITHDFIVVSSGKKPLFIQSVSTSCGCTIPIWPKEAIQPGKQGTVKVLFKPGTSISGYVNKSIVLRSNTKDIFDVVYLKGMVIKDQ